MVSWRSATSVSRSALDETLARVREGLLESRVEQSHWKGRLSSSALSTATALIALSLFERESRARPDGERLESHWSLVRQGAEWLATTQNSDGGWGDTVRSLSNISTTMLCWAALTVSENDFAPSVAAAEKWLADRAGSLDPETLARAVTDRYGADRTFSVPILTVCALAGRLGPPEKAWRLVPQLPFELAVLPHRSFEWLRLPVVSYALPALIALGQVRHVHRPSWNPVLRLIRSVAGRPTLQVLQRTQPQGGGFLEAVPLTSFVVASLAASGQAGHPVASRGVEFLHRSVREDGSWPIDTNLATWLTTLSVNALACGENGLAELSPSEKEKIADWLIAQQYRDVHPYTQAKPGGWAWTDLPGGVPDADDTAGALLALRNLGIQEEAIFRAAEAGARWLLDLQNRDGGIPTFCRGWGKLAFDRSAPDLTAHAILAWLAWRKDLPVDLCVRIDRGLERAGRYLEAAQRQDGAWVPLWFGNQEVPGDLNPTYGTSRVLLALEALERVDRLRKPSMEDRGTRWLLGVQNRDGGWGGDRGVSSSIEETSLAVQALATIGAGDRLHRAVRRGVSWILDRTELGRFLPPSPIGFYFAKLWYFEDLYPVIFTVAALSRAKKVIHAAGERVSS